MRDKYCPIGKAYCHYRNTLFDGLEVKMICDASGSPMDVDKCEVCPFPSKQKPIKNEWDMIEEAVEKISTEYFGSHSAKSRHQIIINILRKYLEDK